MLFRSPSPRVDVAQAKQGDRAHQHVHGLPKPLRTAGEHDHLALLGPHPLWEMAARLRPAAKKHPARIFRPFVVDGAEMPVGVGAGVTEMNVMAEHVGSEPAVAAQRTIPARPRHACLSSLFRPCHADGRYLGRGCFGRPVALFIL